MGRKLIIGIAANRPQAGKSTFMHTMERVLEDSGMKRFSHFAFAAPLKKALSLLISEASGEDMEAVLERMDVAEYKNSVAEPASVFGGRTVRQLLQLMGTEFGRELVNRDMWVNMLASRIKNSAALYDVFAVDDMRMANEYEALKGLAGSVFRFIPVYIYRPPLAGTPCETHSSEGGMDFLKDMPGCITIYNTGTLEEYSGVIEETVLSICRLQRKKMPLLSTGVKQGATDYI